MRLTKLPDFRSMAYTPGSAPAVKTLRARIKSGTQPGGVIVGGRYYVDLDEWERVTGMRKKLEESRNHIARDPLLAGLV